MWHSELPEGQADISILFSSHPKSTHFYFNVSTMCKNMMTEIFVKSMQLTAVLNKVNTSKLVLTLVKHEVFLQVKVSLKLHIHEGWDNFIRDKSPHFCMFNHSLLYSLDLGLVVVFYIAACFLVLHMTFASYCLSYLNVIFLAST